MLTKLVIVTGAVDAGMVLLCRVEETASLASRRPLLSRRGDRFPRVEETAVARIANGAIPKN